MLASFLIISWISLYALFLFLSVRNCLYYLRLSPLPLYSEKGESHDLPLTRARPSIPGMTGFLLISLEGLFAI